MIRGVSLVICCHNSANRLPQTLFHLAKQKVQELQWEIIVVDNCSTDSTAEIAAVEWRKFDSSASLRIVREGNSGLSFARAKGIEVAKYDVLIFCDDDNHLQEDYLSSVKNILETVPNIGVLGGWSKPGFLSQSGSWIEDFYGALAIEKYPRREGIVDWVFGAGMVVKKSIFAELKSRGINLLLTDRQGKKQTSGGDTEICLIAEFIGFNVYYSPKLVLEHCISENRLRKAFFFKTSHQNFYAVMYLYILGELIVKENIKPAKIYLNLVAQRINRIVYFLPRLFGKHSFYSIISIYGNILFVIWIIGSVNSFFVTTKLTKKNLYHENLR